MRTHVCAIDNGAERKRQWNRDRRRKRGGESGSCNAHLYWNVEMNFSSGTQHDVINTHSNNECTLLRSEKREWIVPAGGGGVTFASRVTAQNTVRHRR